MAAFVPIRNKGKFVKRATLIRSQNGRKQGIARNRLKELNEHTDHTYSKTEEEVHVLGVSVRQESSDNLKVRTRPHVISVKR